MTDLVRPVGGQSLFDSDGAGTLSTTLIDAAFDVIEANEDALLVRTSSDIVTTDRFSDIAELTLNTAETTTGWYAIKTDLTDGNPGPSTSTTHSQGTNSIQAYLTNTPADLTGSLYVNLTEVGYASGLDVIPGQNILVDVLLSQTAGESPFYNAFTRYAVTLASGADMAGTLEVKQFFFADVQTFLLNTWYTIAVPVGVLTNIRSIGMKKVITGGSTGARARWHLDNIRRSATTPLDQAYATQDEVAVVVPPSYTTTGSQLPVEASATKSILDLRPEKIHGGVRWVDDYQLDTTGTDNITDDLQRVLDSLVDGETLVGSPQHIYRVEGSLDLQVPGITFDFNGAKLVQRARGIERIIIFRAQGVTVKNGSIFGFTSATQDGSVMTTVAGSPSNTGTTKILAATNDEVRIPIIPGTTLSHAYSRDENYENHFSFTLHDTIPAANDCVVTIKDHKTGATLQSTTLSLTNTPATYTVDYTPSSITTRLIVTVKKTAGTGNVTVTDYTHYGFAAFSNLNEEAFGFAVSSGGDDCVVENFLIEGVSGDGIGIATQTVTAGAQRFTARNVLIRNVSRQGIAPCGGRDHRFIDCTVIFGARHAVDFEPETSPDALDGCYFENFWIVEPRLQAFQAVGGAGWGRVRNIHIKGALIQMDTSVGAISVGGYNGAYFSDIVITRTDDPTTDDDFASFTGRNIICDNWQTDEGIQIDTGAATDENAVAYVSGGITLKNISFTRHPHIGYINVLSAGVHLENITAVAGSSINTAYSLGGIGLMPDTTYTNINLAMHRTQLANSWRGIATQAWFPTGLDLKNEPVTQMRALSGGTTKGNNLGRMSQAVTAASITATVVFPTKTAQNWTNFVLGSTTGGTLTPSTTYYYRVAGRPRRGGPVLALTEKSIVMTAGTGTAGTITLTGTYNTTTGQYVDGATVYRGVAPGVYTTRYDITPTAELAAWGVTGLTQPFQIALKDLGTTITIAAGNYFYHGYTFPYASTTGTVVPADETGFEPDVAYAVFIEPSWQTTWRVSAKRTNGFDIEFGVPAPTSSGTFNWMIARF